MRKHAVLFDLGNTLVSYYHKDEFLPVLRESVKGCLDTLAGQGLHYEFDQVLEKAVAQDAGNDDHSVTPLDKRLAAIFPEPAVKILMPALMGSFMGPIFGTAKVMEGAHEILSLLKARKHPLALVSNTPWGSPSALWNSHLDDLGIGGYFAHKVFCVDVGWRKPHLAIFHHTLGKLGVHARHAVFVGDDPEWDLQGAQQAGIKHLLFDPSNRHGHLDVPRLGSLMDLAAHL